MWINNLFLSLILIGFLSCEHDHLTNELRVVNGSGSGNFTVGRSVTLTADPASAGMGFFRWEGDTIYIDEPRSPVAQLLMPLADVEVRATYRNLPTYTLTVVDGTGSGDYLAGTRIAISATAPGDDQRFVSWSGDTTYVTRTDTAYTFVVMPDLPVNVVAMFEQANDDLISFSNTIVPIFETYCSTPGCHDGMSGISPYVTHRQIFRDREGIRESVITGLMPTNAIMPQAQIDLVVAWIDQGAPNN